MSPWLLCLAWQRPNQSEKHPLSPPSFSMVWPPGSVPHFRVTFSFTHLCNLGWSRNLLIHHCSGCALSSLRVLPSLLLISFSLMFDTVPTLAICLKEWIMLLLSLERGILILSLSGCSTPTQEILPVDVVRHFFIYLIHLETKFLYMVDNSLCVFQYLIAAWSTDQRVVQVYGRIFIPVAWRG